MTSVRFTHMDQLRPTYCRTCHTRIPGRVRETNGGLCRRCVSSGSRDAKEIMERHQVLADAKKAALKLHSTGHGECPECHSANLAEIPKTATNNLRARLIWAGLASVTAAGVGAVVFGEAVCAPVLIPFGAGLIFFVGGWASPPKRVLGKLRLCNHCAHRWEVRAP